jgi:hypothetical protein
MRHPPAQQNAMNKKNRHDGMARGLWIVHADSLWEARVRYCIQTEMQGRPK